MTFGINGPECGKAAARIALSALLLAAGNDLSRRQHAVNQRSVELVLAFGHIPRVVSHPDDERGQGSFLVKRFLAHRHRQDSVETMLAIGRLVAVLADIPGKDADLVEIKRQAIVGIGYHREVLGNLLIAVYNLVE